MKIHLSRAVIAFGMGAGLWLGTVSSFAAPQQTKDQDQSSQSRNQPKKDQKSSTTQAPTQDKPRARNRSRQAKTRR